MAALKLTVNHVSSLERLLGMLSPEEQIVIDRMLVNPYKNCMLDLMESLHLEKSQVYNIRARAIKNSYAFVTAHVRGNKKSYRPVISFLSLPVRLKRYRTLNRIPFYSLDGFYRIDIRQKSWNCEALRTEPYFPYDPGGREADGRHRCR